MMISDNSITKGAVHKVRHARGEGVREGVKVCDRGGVQEYVTSQNWGGSSEMRDVLGGPEMCDRGWGVKIGLK